MSAVLGVPTILYLPFCIFNLMSPILTVIYGFTGFKILRVPPATWTQDDHPQLDSMWSGSSTE